MKSNIKRWGIGVFLVAIICLVTSFCLLSTANEKNFGFADSTINDEQKANPQDNIPAISETIELDGADLAAQSAKWSTAVTKALTGKHILVKLVNEWTAAYGGFVTDDTTGFLNKIMCVPTGATITLDLNGNTINRNLQVFRDIGGIFAVSGTLIVKDSTYNHDSAVNTYNNDNYQGVYNFAGYRCGKIQGGRNTDGGGAIRVINGTFIMDGGMLLDNRANDNGGAIFATNSNVIINEGIIYHNIVEGRDQMNGGGAICTAGTSKLDIYNGIFNNNSATKLQQDDGGVIAIRNGECNIYDGIFSNNFSEDSGGVMVTRNGVINISGGRFEYNNALAGGAFYFAEGTNSVSITNANITNNFVRIHGSAIYCSMNPKTLIPIYISDTIIKDNISSSNFGAFCRYFDLTLGKNVQIYDNYIKDKPSDLCIDQTSRVKCSEDLGNSRIGITIASSYTGGDVFASDYTTYNSKEAYNYFFNNTTASIATTKGNDVTFDKTISGGKYDFIYLDGGRRVNYNEKSIIHTTNDFELRKNVNGGKMVLGNITCGTSVNSFLQNLNFADNRIKLYDNKNNVIYDYNNNQTGYSHLYDDGANLAIGTGWCLEVYSQSNSVVEKVYLSVLGDITGDGKVNSADVNYLRRIISDNMFESFADKPYIQLAALIVNKNGLVNTDADILWQVICNKIDIKSFF